LHEGRSARFLEPALLERQAEQQDRHRSAEDDRDRDVANLLRQRVANRLGRRDRTGGVTERDFARRALGLEEDRRGENGAEQHALHHDLRGFEIRDVRERDQLQRADRVAERARRDRAGCHEAREA